MHDEIREALYATAGSPSRDGVAATDAAIEQHVAWVKEVIQRFLDHLSDDVDGMSVAELARAIDET